MNIKRMAVYFLRILALPVGMSVSFMVAAAVANPGAAATQSAQEAAQAGLAVLVVSSINALVLAWPLARARWYGLKLMGACGLLLFGIQTFMSQIETLFFGGAFDISTAQMRSIIVMGLLTALLFAPFAVLVMGKWRAPGGLVEPSPRLRLSWSGWTGRLLLLPAVYVALYFVFGYFIAWQSPDVRQLYAGSTDILPFGEHLAQTVRTSPALFGFQYVRGLIWIGLAMPVLFLMRGRTGEKSLAIGLLFGLLLTTQLLIPNPYMPSAVRWAHFVETSTSTLLYGWLIGQSFALTRLGAVSQSKLSGQPKVDALLA